MTQPRTVGLFLMDGTSDGRIKCSLDNWVGKVYLIPRTEVTRSKDRPELTQTGIYLLLGTDDASGDDFVYVGQAQERKNGNGVLGRVAEHLNEKDKDYFTHAIVIIDSENSFGPTEISYLENAFYKLAKDADRYEVKNQNVPPSGNVTEEKQASLDKFIDSSKTIISALGYRVFDPVVSTGPDRSSSAEHLSSPSEQTLYLSTSTSSGEGRQTSDGFVVLKGAHLCKKIMPSIPRQAKRDREKYSNRISDDWILLQDTLFTSPSAASSFITAYSTSGKSMWKSKAGKKLGKLEQEAATLPSSRKK